MSTGWTWAYPQPDGSDLLQRLARAEVEIRQLKDRQDRLERQLDEVRARAPLHVEYHFDQLKVNELKGTLNVGLSPQGVQGVDSFETPTAENWQVTTEASTNAAGEPLGMLQKNMEEYMDLKAPAVLNGLEQKYGVSLGGARREQAIRDVKKQLNERVHYYAKTSSPYPAEGTVEERRSWERSVMEKTIRDVGTAFQSYLEGLKR